MAWSTQRRPTRSSDSKGSNHCSTKVREGLKQTHAYMDRRTEGHLVIFDVGKSWDNRREENIGDTKITVWGIYVDSGEDYHAH